MNHRHIGSLPIFLALTGCLLQSGRHREVGEVSADPKKQGLSLADIVDRGKRDEGCVEKAIDGAATPPAGGLSLTENPEAYSVRVTWESGKDIWRFQRKGASGSIAVELVLPLPFANHLLSDAEHQKMTSIDERRVFKLLDSYFALLAEQPGLPKAQISPVLQSRYQRYRNFEYHHATIPALVTELPVELIEKEGRQLSSVDLAALIKAQNEVKIFERLTRDREKSELASTRSLPELIDLYREKRAVIDQHLGRGLADPALFFKETGLWPELAAIQKGQNSAQSRTALQTFLQTHEKALVQAGLYDVIGDPARLRALAFYMNDENFAKMASIENQLRHYYKHAIQPRFKIGTTDAALPRHARELADAAKHFILTRPRAASAHFLAADNLCLDAGFAAMLLDLLSS